ncbi:MAG TPA: hypothetical protein PK970_00635 [Hyphomicrobiaceae bacterium]|nr:hypothetical protein [Hyphomicrobiaceae bacterium]
MAITHDALKKRHIRRTDYVSCSVAFIDCKKPGSHLKENYSIIGPGVTSSTEQVINLPEPHGFNIGAAAMPNGITNNLHIHFTAEVFMCFRGQWTFRWGSNGENEFVGREGDIVSVPTWVFRGFTNTGPDNGWLFTCLGGDNTGGVIFHPDIIEEAAGHGLYISSKNILVDTSKGDRVPAPSERIAPMSREDVAKLRVVSHEAMRARVVTAGERDFRPAFIDRGLPGCGAEIAPVIGYGLTQNRDHQAKILNPHGFSMEWLRLKPGQKVSSFVLPQKMVIINKTGALTLNISGEASASITLGAWDTYSVPGEVTREIINAGSDTAEMLVIVSGDERKMPRFSKDVLKAAASAGDGLDAGGFVAPRHLLPEYGMAAE